MSTEPQNPPDPNVLIVIRKDLLWGSYVELRTHARHTETVRANALSYVMVLTTALTALISVDGVDADDWVLACALIVNGFFGVAIALAYPKRYHRNRLRAERVRGRLDDLYLGGVDSEFSLS